jgi:hypothetical protein
MAPRNDGVDVVARPQAQRQGMTAGSEAASRLRLAEMGR